MRASQILPEFLTQNPHDHDIDGRAIDKGGFTKATFFKETKLSISMTRTRIDFRDAQFHAREVQGVERISERQQRRFRPDSPTLTGPIAYDNAELSGAGRPVDLGKVHKPDKNTVDTVFNREGRAPSALIGEDLVIPSILHRLRYGEAITHDCVTDLRIVSPADRNRGVASPNRP